MRPLRLLILLCALAALGLGAGVLGLRPWARESHGSSISVAPARSLATSEAPDDGLRPRAPRQNPAAQKAGPADPVMQTSAATAAENAAKAAADLAKR